MALESRMHLFILDMFRSLKVSASPAFYHRIGGVTTDQDNGPSYLARPPPNPKVSLSYHDSLLARLRWAHCWKHHDAAEGHISESAPKGPVSVTAKIETKMDSTLALVW
jgi:hypothetical protein